MTNSNAISLSTLLCLPAPDVKALGIGQLIFAIPSLFIRPGQQFFLCPTENLDGVSQLEWCYQKSFQAEAQLILDALEYDVPEINFWATCEKSMILSSSENLKVIESLSIWQKEWLISKVQKEGQVFISILRVHRLVNPFSLPAEISYQNKLGKFISLKSSCELLDSFPLLSSENFAKRKYQLENLEPPEHPELEQIQKTIAYYAQDHPEAENLSNQLREFLGWSEGKATIKDFPDWIAEITKSGNSSDGNLFEQRVRQAFIELGFTNTLNNIKASLDPNATGGAGGIDIYCENPYPIVGECKASKNESVPNSVSAQLIHLGNTHLGKNQFDASIKIIFASGKLTDHAEKAAIENGMNVMRPETLQRLVELKTVHPGAIDLLKLKPCLENAPFGTDADKKVNEFIDNIWNQLKVRSLIVQTVQTLQSDNEKNITATVVRIHFNATAKIDHKLDSESITHSLLLELSSPLTGYLGRTKGDAWKTDRFYFLRDLIV